jgi:hypothetical protein
VILEGGWPDSLYRVVPLPQLQQEVMANRDREQEIYDYYSNEAIVVRLEQLQRLSSSLLANPPGQL